MALSRRFQFFDTDQLRDPVSGEPFKGLADIEGICCWSSGHGVLVFGDKDGCVHIVGKKGGLVVSSFRAYDASTNLVHQFAQHDVLISVGLDLGVDEQRVKVWSLDHRTAAAADQDGGGGSGPQCCRVLRVTVGESSQQQPAQMPPPFVTCLTAHENLNNMLLGFSTGLVQLHRGDVKKERHSRCRVILEADRSVTNLHAKMSADSRILTVFATTERAVYALMVTAKDQVTKVELERSFGANPGCSCLTEGEPDPQLVVANKSVAYFYSLEGRGACTAFDMEIDQIRWFRSYLVALGRRGPASDQQQQQPVQSQQLQGSIAASIKDTHMLNVYETKHKFSAMYNPFRGVRAVLAEWGSLLLLQVAESRLQCLAEKDASAKMEILFRKNNFRLAIDLANALHYDAEGLAEIYRQHADYLYQKGDFDGSVGEYCRTIGHLEASYVIRKFLDASRIHNLTAYLEAVHKARLASADHTTLLLNCYSKLKDEAKLNAFLESHDTAFDAETAIRVLRQANFGKQALALADRFGKHEWHLKIQVCDLGQHSPALRYMAGLPDKEAMRNMRLYGRELLAACPAETTDLLKRLIGSAEISVDIAELSPIFLGNPSDMIAILEHCLALLGSPSARPQLTETLLDLHIQRLAEDADSGGGVGGGGREKRILELLDAGFECYDKEAFLLRCYLTQFWPGVLYLCERTGRYDLLLRRFTECGQHENLLRLCEKVGHKHKDLWRQALLHYARSDEPDAQRHLASVLQNMRRTGLMTPLAIVTLLCNHTQATVGSVADFLIDHLRDEAELAEADERIVREARDRTQAIQRQIEELQSQPRVFQNQRCSICNSQLDIPSVHFLCDHSFHLHCFQSFSDTETECPNCAAENREAMEAVTLWRSQSGDSAARLVDTLCQASSSATFAIISDSIAKGVLGRGGGSGGGVSFDQPPQASGPPKSLDLPARQQTQQQLLHHASSSVSVAQTRQQQGPQQQQQHALSSSVGSHSAYPDKLNPFG